MKACKTLITSSVVLAGLLGIFGTDFSIADKKQETKYSERYQKRREEIIRFDNGKISGIKTFLDDKLINEKYWSIYGKNTVDTDYKYSNNDDTYEKIFYTTDTTQKHVKDKELLRGSPEGKSTRIKKWFYDSKTYRLLTSEYYKEGTEIVEKLDTYDQEGKLEKTYVYFYTQTKEGQRVKGFDCYDTQGKLAGSYNENANLNIEDVILSKDTSPEQIRKWLQVYNSKRTPVAIIDSGFDTNHDLLTYKLWKNPEEILNGKDDDNNGWADDIMGWNRHENKYMDININSPNINEIIVLRGHEHPSSHGTHVASITLKDTDKFALVGFAGDMTDPAYLNRISKFLKEHNILFANMSFGFGEMDSSFAPKTESFYALEKLIQENPQTLIFVSAGNDGADLEKSAFKSYPVSFPYDNLIVIGALDTDEIIESKLSSYRAACFSTIGVETVDIFAPGTDVEGALIGGGLVRKSGTSMASPYALNLALKIYEENPNLKPMEIKEIILKTAYVNPNDPLPAVSKGMIYPSKAIGVAKILKENPSLSVEEAVSQVKASEHHMIPSLEVLAFPF